MPRGNKYVLIAKDNNSNNYEFISFGDEKITKLEKIDLYTMHFENKNELVERLISNGQINNNDVDIFICCSKNSGKEISFMEPMYFAPNLSLSKCLIEVANSFLKKGECDKNSFNKILGVFENKIVTNRSFYEMVVYEQTNLYGKFTNYIKKTGAKYGFIDKIKYNDGGWVFDSYPLARNIVEAINRFDKLSLAFKDVYGRNRINVCDKNKSRGVIIPSLQEKFKPDHIDGQISMFDMLNGNSNIDIVEAPVVAKIEEKPKKAKISRIDWNEEKIYYSDVDVDTKLSEIQDVLWNLPRTTFVTKYVDGENKGKKFNEDIFEHYDSEKSKKILNTALSSTLINNIHMSLIYRDEFRRAMECYGNTSLVQGEMRYYRSATMKKIKKSSDILDKTYIWCKTFVDCRDKDMEYKNNNSK